MGRRIATYDYTDAEGRCLRKIRYGDPKSFSWEHETAEGWKTGNDKREPTLYRLAAILAADPAEIIYLVEGEKDADRLASLGLLSTCNPHGASKGVSKWRPEFTEALAGRLVVVIPDFDETGVIHAEGVVEALRGAARAAGLLCLSGLHPTGGDVSDWLDRGYPVGKLQSLAGSLVNHELWQQERQRSRAPGGGSSRAPITLSAFLNERREPVPSILGDGVLAKESLNVLAGDPGTGKTLLALNLAIHLAARRPFLGLEVPELCPVVFLEAEGNRDRFRERVETARQSFGLEERDLPIGFAAPGTNFEIGEELELMIDSYGPGLVVLDTIGLFHEGEENSATDWKKFVVKPLRRLIQSTGSAFLLLHHFGKPSEARTGGNRVRGSSAIKGDADTLLLLESAKSGGDLRVLTFDKIKNGPALDSLVLQFDGEHAVFELTSEDAVTALKPRLAEVQRIVNERGEVTTAELKAAILRELDLRGSQAEALISSAHAAGLIEKRKRGVWGRVENFLALPPVATLDRDDVPF